MDLINSNIVFNKNTKQFGIVLWKTENGAKISEAGTWPHDEYVTLTVKQARHLYIEEEESWISPTKECIVRVFAA